MPTKVCDKIVSWLLAAMFDGQMGSELAKVVVAGDDPRRPSRKTIGRGGKLRCDQTKQRRRGRRRIRDFEAGVNPLRTVATLFGS